MIKLHHSVCVYVCVCVFSLNGPKICGMYFVTLVIWLTVLYARSSPQYTATEGPRVHQDTSLSFLASLRSVPRSLFVELHFFQRLFSCLLPPSACGCVYFPRLPVDVSLSLVLDVLHWEFWMQMKFWVWCAWDRSVQSNVSFARKGIVLACALLSLGMWCVTEAADEKCLCSGGFMAPRCTTQKAE